MSSKKPVERFNSEYTERNILEFPDLSKLPVDKNIEFIPSHEIPLKRRILFMLIWDAIFIIGFFLLYYIPIASIRIVSYYFLIFGIATGSLFILYKRFKPLNISGKISKRSVEKI